MSHDPLVGRVLGGKYELCAAIGSGATGRVYRARQLTLERDVAVKVLRPSCIDRTEVVARFRLEARAASMLSHPGIVTVVDWGEEPDGLLYLVVEHLGGADLFDVAHAEGPFSSVRIAKLMIQVAHALAHAHAHGIIHRDLKPENLRIVRDATAYGATNEVVKIYDFGTAFVAGVAAPGVTEAGMVVGTPDYFSPEQASAKPVGPQSDLYACGVIMFFLATGKLPFVGKSAMDLAYMHLSTPPERPSHLRADLDPRLERIILQCLAKRPSDRPASALDLAAMLVPIAAETPVAAPAPELPRRRGAGMAAVWGMAIGAAITALAGLGWALSGGPRDGPRHRPEPSGAASVDRADGGADAAVSLQAREMPVEHEEPQPRGSAQP